jgi:replication factor C subunit 3/5
MTFINRNKPNTIHDLVFANDRTKQIIQDFANGHRTGHVILHGPPGAGKSEAARAIVRARLGEFADSGFADPMHGNSLDSQSIDRLANEQAWQRMQNGEAWTIIDEVDFASEKTQKALREFIDSNPNCNIICTTNNLHKLDDALQDRCQKVKVERPSAEQWISRAGEIMRREGHALDDAQIGMLLDGFEGSARDLIRELEHYHNRLPRN